MYVPVCEHWWVWSVNSSFSGYFFSKLYTVISGIFDAPIPATKEGGRQEEEEEGEEEEEEEEEEGWKRKMRRVAGVSTAFR